MAATRAAGRHLLLSPHHHHPAQPCRRLRILAAHNLPPSTPQSHPPLDAFPRLNRTHIQNHRAARDPPLPRDRPVLEDLGIYKRNVHNGEHAREARHDREEQEVVAVQRREDGERRGPGVGRIHVEQRAREVLDLPRCDEQQQRNGRVRRCARPEHNVARLVPAFVAPGPEVALSGAHVSDDGEAEQAQSAHEEAIDEFVRDELRGEDTGFDVMGRAQHAVFLRFLEAETDGEEGGCDEVDPEDFDGGEREDGMGVEVFEGEANEQEDDLRDVGDQEVQEELGDC
jgi:hypothetical protein